MIIIPIFQMRKKSERPMNMFTVIQPENSNRFKNSHSGHSTHKYIQIPPTGGRETLPSWLLNELLCLWVYFNRLQDSPEITSCIPPPNYFPLTTLSPSSQPFSYGKNSLTKFRGPPYITNLEIILQYQKTISFHVTPAGEALYLRVEKKHSFISLTTTIPKNLKRASCYMWHKL